MDLTPPAPEGTGVYWNAPYEALDDPGVVTRWWPVELAVGASGCGGVCPVAPATCGVLFEPSDAICIQAQADLVLD